MKLETEIVCNKKYVLWNKATGDCPIAEPYLLRLTLVR